MNAYRRFKRNNVITSHWYLIYRILWLIGGISGGILFYRKTINLGYNYLTSYGFHHPAIIGEFENLTLLVINGLFIYIILCMLFQMVFSKHMVRRYTFLDWMDAYFSILCSIGFLIASINFLNTNPYDLLTVVWLFYIGSVCIFRIVMPVMISRGYFDNSVRAFIKK